jgi:hypothetical protein
MSALSLASDAAATGESEQQHAPPAPAPPSPVAPTTPLGAPRRAMGRSWLMHRGCCTTAQGKAWSTTSGSY